MMTPKRLARELTGRLYGPHADEHTAAAADLAAEAIRFLNYATGSGSLDGLAFPSTVYSVAADLSAAAWRMQQLFTQLGDWLTAADAFGLLGTDDGTPPGCVVEAARTQLADATVAAGDLSVCLDALHNSISGLNGHGPSRPGGAS
jgi:hypothetical protein